jgi:hypothetical protein
MTLERTENALGASPRLRLRSIFRTIRRFDRNFYPQTAYLLWISPRPTRCGGRRGYRFQRWPVQGSGCTRKWEFRNGLRTSATLAARPDDPGVSREIAVGRCGSRRGRRDAAELGRNREERSALSLATSEPTSPLTTGNQSRGDLRKLRCVQHPPQVPTWQPNVIVASASRPACGPPSQDEIDALECG